MGTGRNAEAHDQAILLVTTNVAVLLDEIGRLAATAAIRTFLDFFLGRDLVEVSREGTTEKKAV